MTIKTLMTAAALIMGPTLSAYAGCSDHSQQAMTCADGSAYDAESGTCKVVTG